MATNPNPSLRNKNTLYLGMSGAGKSQALLQKSGIPSRGVRVLLLDPNHDHPCHRINDAKHFAQQVRAGIRSGKGFRLALDVPKSEENLERFCRIAYAALDGNYPTYIIIEELAGWTSSIAKAPPATSVLLNEGRKFGMQLHVTFQKSQEVPKTVYDQCEIRWVGKQKTLRQRKYIAEEIGVTVEDIASLKELEFFYEAGGEPAKRIQLNWVKPPHHK